MLVVPWVAIAFAVALWSIPGDSHREAPKWQNFAGPMILLIIGGVAALGFGLGLGGELLQYRWNLFGITIGLLVPCGIVALEGRSTSHPAGWIASVAVAVAVAGWTILQDLPSTSAIQIGVLVGSGCAATLLCAGLRPRPSYPLIFVASFGSIVAAGLLGGFAGGEITGGSGVVLGLAAVVSTSLAMFVSRLSKDASPFLFPAISSALFLLAGWMIAKQYFHEEPAGWAVMAGSVGALATYWMLPDSEGSSPFGALLCAVLWTGVATYAFSGAQGWGMAISLLTGTTLLLAFGGRRALAAASPLAALVLYRLFREQYTEASRALDIGQHYAIIGVFLGVLLVLGAAEWVSSRARKEGPLANIGAALAGLLTIYVLFGTMAFLGAKGVVGLLIGIGIAPLIGALISSSRALPNVVWSYTLMGLVLGAYEWLGSNMDLSREQKSSFVIWFVAIGVLSAAVVRFIGGGNKREAIS